VSIEPPLHHDPISTATSSPRTRRDEIFWCETADDHKVHGVPETFLAALDATGLDAAANPMGRAQ